MQVKNQIERMGSEEAGLSVFSRTGADHERTAVMGYASCSSARGAGSRELKLQASVIKRECERHNLRLIELVADREPDSGKGLSRPGLAYALDRIRSGDATGLIVSELSRITYSAAELGTIVEWLSSQDLRLIAAASSLDTDNEYGRLAAQLIIEVSRWERTRLSQRTRKGLEAARMRGKTTGRSAVADNRDLTERINQMRAQGMTLQAIADRLNEEGVPTVRGGAKWRHSSVQAAAGYRRRKDRLPHPLLVQHSTVPERSPGGAQRSLARSQAG